MNALDYLFHEWAYKPVGFVSSGGVAGGKAADAMLTELKRRTDALRTLR